LLEWLNDQQSLFVQRAQIVTRTKKWRYVGNDHFAVMGHKPIVHTTSKRRSILARLADSVRSGVKPVMATNMDLALYSCTNRTDCVVAAVWDGYARVLKFARQRG
jgi:hypothetical protein